MSSSFLLKQSQTLERATMFSSPLNSPQKVLDFFFVVVFIHLFHVQFNVRLCVKGVFLKIESLHSTTDIESFASKVISTRDIWNNTFAFLSVEWRSHPHVPVDKLIWFRPFRLQFIFKQLATQHPERIQAINPLQARGPVFQNPPKLSGPQRHF